MKFNAFHFVIMLASLLGGFASLYGQDPLGPHPKKARTVNDYAPRSLTEITKAPSESGKCGNLLPSRARVTYAGRTRALLPERKSFIHRWAQLCASAPETYTKSFETEMLFIENGVEYWLPVRNYRAAEIQKKIKEDTALNLFFIRLAGVSTDEQVKSVLLLEMFEKPEV